MPGPAILLKLAGTPNQGLAGLSLGAAGPGLTLKPLFSLDGGAAAQGLAPSRPQTWFRAETADPAALASPADAWDAAHAALREGLGVGGVSVLAAEPDIEQGWPAPRRETALAAADPNQPAGQKGAPFDVGPGFGWHLDDRHSGLAAARTIVGPAGNTITIAHLDTGYDPTHLALPANLDKTRQRNFVETATPNSAVDTTPMSGPLTNRGHGTGTIGILAGGSTVGLRSALAIPADFGPLGGAPEAKVVPVRVANSVVHFWTSTVAQGIDYARQIGADVLSMSMGGLPASSWADAVNAAYEAGVVLVCAAGNSFNGLPTSLIVYPARFDRVIAACGVMAQGNPYYGLDGNVMEGCAGPASKMATAMAAYTPNTTWLKLGFPAIVDMDGAGTSSATPQIAAAAALWLAQHGDKYPRSWQRVEAVRAALFGSAERGGRNAGDPHPLFGRGLLRARDALNLVPDRASLRQTSRDSASFAFLHLLSSIFGATEADPRRLAMLRLEIAQLALMTRAASEAVPDPDQPAPVDGAAQRRMLEIILDEGAPSATLGAYLRTYLGRPSVPVRPAPPPPPNDESATSSSRGPKSGASIKRRLVTPKPTRRRLRIFATDPGDSRSLSRSFVNIATVEVPWEESLDPGPVGEYLEVVDIDPACNAAYPPVDLQDRYLLAQDGLAPSEGNPQFHQQMVYAVAMRTIRNFEVALGRRALWAERLVPGGTDFRPEYVQRLRIYPHALREQNAYYSPDRKALLFGYFSDTSDASRGRSTVFTCLSHDIVAHETTHALLDGMHRRFQDDTNPDVLAFHEAFADIVAIFQHFTFPELLRYELRRLRGNMSQASILSDLARQFGRSLHNSRALRQAIQPSAASPRDDDDPSPIMNYVDEPEPHRRGAILVAAIFEAFAAIFKRRTDDLMRLATSGTGLLGPGELSPDLVERLAQEAVAIAQRILTTAIRALDYMPPIDPTFGDYLRAIVTADADLAPDASYRVAFAQAFARRGIYPGDVPNVSPDGLLWQGPADPGKWAALGRFLRNVNLPAFNDLDRERAYQSARASAASLHGWLERRFEADKSNSLAYSLGLDPELKFEVHSVRPAQRVTRDGETRTDIVAVITQRAELPVDLHEPQGRKFTFRGGCTLLLDREYDADCPVRFAISRPIFNDRRADRVRKYQYGGGTADTFAAGTHGNEPFALVHALLGRE